MILVLIVVLYCGKYTGICYSSDNWKEQGGSFSPSTAPSNSNYKITFKKAFTTSVNSFGGFVKTVGSANYGQYIFQNGTVTLTYGIASVIAYNSNGVIQHSTSGNTAYWYASGY